MKYGMAVLGLVVLLLAGTWNTAGADITHSGGTITEYTVWRASDNVHIVTGNYSVAADATLVIEAGCEVRFDNAVSINVYGGLVAPGTAADGILFTRRDPTDEWSGLSFAPDAAGNLEYCTFEYVTRYVGYAVYCNQAMPTIEHCTFRDNDYGLYLRDVTAPTLAVNNVFQDNLEVGIYLQGCSDPSFSNQTLTGHTAQFGAIRMVSTSSFLLGAGNAITGNSWGVTMDLDSYPDPACYGNIPTAGNTNSDGIQVYAGSLAGSAEWPVLGTDYIVTANGTVAGGGVLDIQPGVTVRFDNALQITNYGTINALGTAADGILFTRRDPTDEWSGLTFSPGSGGSLEYCTFEHATRYEGTAVYCNESMPTIEHCTFRDNDYGLYLRDVTAPTLSVNNTFQDNLNVGIFLQGCTDPDFSNQTLTGHTSQFGAIRMVGTSSFLMGAGNAITGNSWGLTMDFDSYPDPACYGNIPTAGNTNSDGIQVYAGSLSGTAEWPVLGTDYIVTANGNVAGGGVLEVMPGVTVKFDNATQITNYGTINALGTAVGGILFTRRDPADEWSRLTFASGSGGRLEYCTFEHATRYEGNAVYCNESMPSIEHCTFRDNDYGLYLRDVTAPTLTVNNVFQDNLNVGIFLQGCTDPDFSNQTLTGHTSQFGAIRMVGTSSFLMGAGNAITGNSWGLTMDFDSYPDPACYGNIPTAGNTNSDGIQVYAGSLSGAAEWPVVGADYIVTANGNIAAGGVLDIRPGVNVKFDNASSINIYGTLNALGTAADGILFTRRDPADEWSGLTFSPSSGGSLEYCTFEHATRYEGNAVYCNETMPTIEHCTFRDNDYGLYLRDITAPTLSVNNTFQDNLNVGIFATGCSDPSFSNQTLTGHASQFGAIRMVSTSSFLLGTGNAITGNSWGLTMDFDSYPDPACYGNIPTAGNTNSDGIQVYAGSLSGAAEWPVVGADYIVTANGNIAAGGVLDIRPGVNVKFDNASSINIYGTLNALGTAADGILFTRRDPADEWSGLTFSPGSGGNLEYCTFEHVTRYSGHAIYCNQAEPKFDHCTFRQNDFGLYIRDATLSLLNCLVTDNLEYGIYLHGAADLNLGGSPAEWNDIHSNGGGVPDHDLHNGTETVYATYVYWGTVEVGEIEDLIHHEPDDASLGRVQFGPWVNAAHDTEYSDGVSAVPDDTAPEIPTAFGLDQNCPNPFNPATTISYDLPRDSHVELVVFDLAGRRVATLVDARQAAGARSVTWQPRDLASGMYLYCIKADGFEQIRKMTLVR